MLQYSEQLEELVEWRLLKKGSINRSRAAKNLYKEPRHRQIIRDRKRKAKFLRRTWMWFKNSNVTWGKKKHYSTLG